MKLLQFATIQGEERPITAVEQRAIQTNLVQLFVWNNFAFICVTQILNMPSVKTNNGQ